MTSPLPLPDWVPWWVHLVLLLAVLFFAVLFLLMPFSLFGARARLDLIEARLDEIQGEIRALSLRLPEPVSGHAEEHDLMEDEDEEDGPARHRLRPPIPPPPRRPAASAASAARRRTEPRLY